MTTGNASDDPRPREPALFAARLTPHRSLSRSGFVLVMAVLSVVSFAAGTVFLLMGAWPVFGFFGLDVLLVYWAFRANYRAAAAYEEVVVTSSELRVRKVSHRGQVSEWSLNPLWAKLDYEIDEEFGLQRLYLVSRGRKLPAAAGEGNLRGRSLGGDLGGQARPDPDGIGVSRGSVAEIGWRSGQAGAKSGP
jgi:uncharacterized membrane protein